MLQDMNLFFPCLNDYKISEACKPYKRHRYSGVS